MRGRGGTGGGAGERTAGGEGQGRERQGEGQGRGAGDKGTTAQSKCERASSEKRKSCTTLLQKGSSKATRDSEKLTKPA